MKVWNILGKKVWKYMAKGGRLSCAGMVATEEGRGGYRSCENGGTAGRFGS